MEVTEDKIREIFLRVADAIDSSDWQEAYNRTQLLSTYLSKKVGK